MDGDQRANLLLLIQASADKVFAEAEAAGTPITPREVEPAAPELQAAAPESPAAPPSNALPAAKWGTKSLRLAAAANAVTAVNKMTTADVHTKF